MLKTNWTKRVKKAPGGKRRTIDMMRHNELEGLLDREFSEYIRKKAAKGGDTVTCVTCGKQAPWKEMDCGHYIGRTFRFTRWSEYNVAVQCPHCNRYLGGVQHEMRAYLVDVYGEETIRSQETGATMYRDKKNSKEFLIEEIKKYRVLNRDRT